MHQARIIGDYALRLRRIALEHLLETLLILVATTYKINKRVTQFLYNGYVVIKRFCKKRS
jgi:hypothetical protein